MEQVIGTDCLVFCLVDLFPFKTLRYWVTNNYQLLNVNLCAEGFTM